MELLMKNKQLYDLVVAAGEHAGRVVDYPSMKNRRPADDERCSVITDPIASIL
jgi:hypothetical protein